MESAKYPYEGKTPLNLNFLLNEPTINGHLYDENELIKEFERRLEDNMLVIISNPNAFLFKDKQVDFNEMVGSARRYEVDENGQITFWCDLDLVINEYVQEVGMEVSIYGIGKINDNKKINNFKLMGLFLYHPRKDINDFLKGGRQCIIKALKERVTS